MCFVLLCRNKADVNTTHNNDGFTPLRMAIEKSDLKMVKYLLQNTDIDVEKGDFRNISPIEAAAVLRDPQKSETQEIHKCLEMKMVVLILFCVYFIRKIRF